LQVTFYGPGGRIFMWLFLRRTLVRQIFEVQAGWIILHNLACRRSGTTRYHKRVKTIIDQRYPTPELPMHISTAQECDARMFNSSTFARLSKIIQHFYAAGSIILNTLKFLTNKMKLKLISLLTFLSIIISVAAYAQLNSGNLSQYTENDGLPGAQVNTLLVDKFGYVWTGTINGLARFDGYRFRRFYSNPNDTTSLQGLIIWSLFEDHKGQVWIGSSPAFLNVYNPVLKQFRQYKFSHLVKHAANVELIASSMCEDSNGRIYFGITTYLNERISSALLYKDEKDDQLKTLETPAGLTIQNITSMTKDKAGNIWILSFWGLFKIDTARKITKVSLSGIPKDSNEIPSDIKIDNNGHVWMITSTSRLYDIDPNTGAYKTWLSDKIMLPVKNDLMRTVIALDSSGNIWMTSNAGIQYFNRRTNQFSVFNTGVKPSLEHTLANHLVVDSYGTLWIGSSTNGLIKYENKAQLKSYIYNKGDKNSITSGWANFIYEGSDGRIWIGTSGSANTSGLNVVDTRTGVLTPIPFSRLANQLDGVFSLWENTPGELYVAGFKKLFALSEKDLTLRPVSLPGAPDTITILSHFIDSRQNEWLSTLSGLYKKGRGARVFTKYDLSKVAGGDASSNQVIKVFESKKHGLWLTTDNGLFLYNYNNDKIERHGFDKAKGDVFVTQDINSFYEDRDGIVWVGPWQGGFSRYDVEKRKIYTYTRNDGLPSMSIQSILPDEKNSSLWLSTFEGLSRLNLRTQQFNNFSIADGIQGQLFADGSALRTSGGLMAFGGSNGVTIFNPDEVDKNSIPPKVFLTDLKVFNQRIIPGPGSVLKSPVYETQQVTLPFNSNNISIEFSVLHYSNPAKNRISYKLENYDNEWREAGSLHEAFYSSLPAGEYTFHVKAANDKGVWNEQGATLKIIIQEPWWRTNLAYIIYGLVIIGIGVFTYRYFQQRLIKREKEKSQARELEQAKEIEKAYYKLEETYEELKATQTQLIQSEKMASLGTLTAGIAHEIQNPLNFVNNFSEVNSDLIKELQVELKAGNAAEALAISDDIRENQQKINHHGKRADAIVKGMLQHSRTSSGQKEAININSFCDEYLRLSYHGLRAKDKTFNAEFKTYLDENIGQIEVAVQDIGRVLLNLFNNAFYTVSEKQKTADSNYKPLVSVQTKKINGKIEIVVTDNGNGIPQRVMDKIFQPFFTTKPAGQGTGLGLSLAYDIIKAHGGELKVETKEGEGSSFIIQLPVDNVG
jgi:signal transduction histidine kinase/ligand-binding sensor domain-containing protein